MNNSLRERYTSHYTNAVSAFVREVGDVNAAGIPEPHLPLWGANYETAKLRTVFIGIDAKSWGEMEFFLGKAREDVQSVVPFKDREGEFRSPSFVTNSSPQSFFGMVMRLLAGFHNIADWGQLKRGQNPEIIQSFAWAETNAVALWNRSAATQWEEKYKKKADKTAWKQLRAASERHLDSFSAILDVFEPHIAVVMSQNFSPSYWGRLLSQEKEKIGERVIYALDSISGTHIFHTAHPSNLNRSQMIDPVVKTICEKWHAIHGST